jgi:D-alanyl-lipoteichoic acid acyltransferase DltB (MBOAT superfamily)
VQFTSLAGLVFVAVAALVCRIAPVPHKPTVILIASYVLYCTWDPGMALALLAATTICFAAAWQIDRTRSSGGGGLLGATAGALVLYICFFKIQGLIGSGSSIAVPLGVSYYTFRLISYVVDVYWGKIPAERNAIRFAAYVAFFPHLVAGPIQRAEEFLPQVRPERTDWRPQIWRGATRILLGLFKKLAVADPVSLLVAYGFAHAGEGSSLPSVLALYLFPLQLYMDFSALTDIAIGVGLLLGIESPENFDRPFMAPNISEFWRRWHMSLTGWLRDYVFTPLRMGLRNWGNVGLVASVTINMLLIALWHGFRTSFLVFGLIHSAYLIVDVLSAPYRKRYYKNHKIAATTAAFLGPLLTYHLVAVADVFFRVPTFSAGAQVLGGLASGLGGVPGAIAAATAPPNHHAWVAFPFAVLAVMGDSARRRSLASAAEMEVRWLRWSAYTVTTVLCVFVVLMMLAVRGEVNPFVYENF